MATIQVNIVSAEKDIFSGEASIVTLPGKAGELGIMPGHEPLITLIQPGFVRIKSASGETQDIFVAGGVLEVQPKLVTVLADLAVRSEELDEARTQQAIEDAKKHLSHTQGDLEIAKVEAQIAALSSQLMMIKKIRKA